MFFLSRSLEFQVVFCPFSLHVKPDRFSDAEMRAPWRLNGTFILKESIIRLFSLTHTHTSAWSSSSSHSLKKTCTGRKQHLPLCLEPQSFVLVRFSWCTKGGDSPLQPWPRASDLLLGYEKIRKDKILHGYWERRAQHQRVMCGLVT